MKTIRQMAVVELSPGLRLAEALLDESGRILMPAGVELNEQVIASLQRRQIEHVVVEVEVATTPAQAEALEGRIRFQLDCLFRHAGKGEETLALRQAIYDYRMGQTQ